MHADTFSLFQKIDHYDYAIPYNNQSTRTQRSFPSMNIAVSTTEPIIVALLLCILAIVPRHIYNNIIHTTITITITEVRSQLNTKQHNTIRPHTAQRTTPSREAGYDSSWKTIYDAETTRLVSDSISSLRWDNKCSHHAQWLRGWQRSDQSSAKPLLYCFVDGMLPMPKDKSVNGPMPPF